MSRLDHLLPDQRAALSLILRQRKTYAELSALLGIPERAVRDRAQGALALLAPREARELPAEQREEVGDYLLGQRMSVAERLRTRTYLNGSAPGRAWANAARAELAPLAASPLPEIPVGEEPPTSDALPAGEETVSPPAGATGPPANRTASSLPSSRRAGALLLAVIAAVVIAAVVLIAGAGGTSSHGGSTAARGTATGQTSTAPARSRSSTGPTAAAAPKATEDKRISLTSPDPQSKAVGVAEVLSEGNKYAFYMAAEHLPPSKGFFYAVWLYNSPTSAQALSKSPPVGADGRLQGGALLPANAGEYHRMLLTRETSNQPTHPGPIVLSGPFALH